MAFVPLLQFDGQCAEAFSFYARIFGADSLSLTRYFELPEAARLPPSDRVVHAELRLGDGVLLGMDFPVGMPAPEGRHTAVFRPVADVETGDLLTDLLMEGGGFPIVPWGPAAWSPGFGILKDRFGILWTMSAGGLPGSPAENTP